MQRSSCDRELLGIGRLARRSSSTRSDRAVAGTVAAVDIRRARQFLILERPDARRQGEQTNEPGRIALLIDVVLAESHETLIVERMHALAPNDRGGALVQTKGDRTGDALLRYGDECIVRL